MDFYAKKQPIMEQFRNDLIDKKFWNSIKKGEPPRVIALWEVLYEISGCWLSYHIMS